MQLSATSIPARIMKVTAIRSNGKAGGYVTGWEAFCYNCNRPKRFGIDNHDDAVDYTRDHKCFAKDKERVTIVAAPGKPKHHNDKLRSGQYGQNTR